MYSVAVIHSDGKVRDLLFDKEKITIGRTSGNDIVLRSPNISKNHSRIVVESGVFVVYDLQSTNGTFVNGEKISEGRELNDGDQISIGEFKLSVDPSDLGAAHPHLQRGGTGHDRRITTGPPPAPPLPKRAPTSPVQDDALAKQRTKPTRSQPTKSRTPRAPTSATSPTPPRGQARTDPASAGRTRSAEINDPRLKKLAELQKEVHSRVIEGLDLRRLKIDQLADNELWERTEKTVGKIVQQMDQDGKIQAFVDREILIKDVLNEALGLGPLEEFLADEEIDEIMVNSATQIYVERGGKLQLTEKTFSSNKAVLGVLERIVSPLGRRIDESSPLVDARLKDGSRVNAIIPPLALRGPTITIRKFRADVLTEAELVSGKTATTGMVDFLKMCVEARKNIVISGGTGSGKTTTLNIVSNFIQAGERVLTIEDAAELQLKHEHWVRLESRPPNIEGKGAIGIRELVKNSLRMRPDRIVIGECRGGETLDMLQAMNTGHDGSLTTTHANTPRDAVARLETMVLMAGVDLPMRAIREQISSAVDIIVQQSRFSDGSRKITHITEVSGIEGNVITLQDIFLFRQEGTDANNRVLGKFVASGLVPRFYEDLQQRGIPVDMSVFHE